MNEREPIYGLEAEKAHAVDGGRLRYGDRLPYCLDSLAFLLT